jgi:cation:H+ antiporter
MNPFDIVLFLVGLLGLYLGAEWMVGGASRLAVNVGIRPIVVGLTVVAFGTSSPELAVSLIAVFEQSDGIAIGNIIGSNIANIGLILGVSALVKPLRVDSDVLRRELPIMVVVSILFIALLYDGTIGLWDGCILFAGLLFYLGYQLKDVFKGDVQEKDARPGEASAPRNGWNVMLILVGLGLLVVGAKLMIDSGVVIARQFGISEIVIGIALVAIGTSLPELATSLVSALRGESDISVGNIIGSNLFNIMCVVGLVAIVSPLSVDRELLYFELPIMLVFSLVLFPFMRTGFVLSRLEGGLLLLGYGLFIFSLF